VAWRCSGPRPFISMLSRRGYILLLHVILHCSLCDPRRGATYIEQTEKRDRHSWLGEISGAWRCSGGRKGLSFPCFLGADIFCYCILYYIVVSVIRGGAQHTSSRPKTRPANWLWEISGAWRCSGGRKGLSFPCFLGADIFCYCILYYIVVSVTRGGAQHTSSRPKNAIGTPGCGKFRAPVGISTKALYSMLQYCGELMVRGGRRHASSVRRGI
jgi:Zn-finger protein